MEKFASDILEDYKKTNVRQFWIIITILVMWFITIGYLVYVLNDIGTIETTTTQEVQQESGSGNNNFIGSNGDITNGKTNDKTTTKYKVRKSKVKNCPVCGKFMGNKGRASVKTRVHK